MIPRLRRDEEEQARFPDAADETMLLQETLQDIAEAPDETPRGPGRPPSHGDAA